MPSYRGAFIQVYFFESCTYSHGVGGPAYLGMVSPSHGWSPASSPWGYSYQEVEMNSFTFCWSYSTTRSRFLPVTMPRGNTNLSVSSMPASGKSPQQR